MGKRSGPKICPKCGRNESQTYFAPIRRTCRECVLAYQASWRESRRDVSNQQALEYRSERREILNQKSKSYYQQHSERLRKRIAGWYWRNHSRISAKRKQYYAENRDILLKEKAEWRDKNRERYRETARRECRRNFLRYRWLSQVRRARVAGATGTHTNDEWFALCEYYKNKCLCCGTTDRLTQDHIVPIARGGSDYIDNIQPLCMTCNLKKGARTIDYRPGSLVCQY